MQTVIHHSGQILSRLIKIWFLVLLTSAGGTAGQQPEISKEYQLKAVFLFNFSQFIEWPADAFPQTDTPFVIGILGPDPFGNYLDETVRNEKVNGRPIIIQRFIALSEITRCHVLFVNQGDKNKLKETIDYATAHHVLTVGEELNFAKQGGMIRFFPVENKIRIRINLSPVRAANLAISSKLLRVAETVEN